MIVRPLFLLGLLLIIPVGLLWRVRYAHGKNSLSVLGGRWRTAVLNDVYLFKSFFSFLFFILFFISGILALAGFRWGEELVAERRKGQELIFLLDISNSMTAEDSPPSRLKAAVQTIGEIVDDMQPVRFSLVVFKGNGLVLIPMTEDIFALRTYLRHVNTQIMTSPGSDLQRGIEVCLQHINQANQYQSVIVFSDGEYLSGNPNAAATQAGRQGVPIFTVAVGTLKGAPLVLPDGTPLLDKHGEPVVSKLRPESLDRIAQLSGGLSFQLIDPQQTAVEVAAALKAQQEGELSYGFKQVKKDRFRLFLSLSISFFMLYMMVRVIRWKNII